MPEEFKKGWTRVAFGDVVRLCRERSRDPERDEIDRYVGLEHLEPGDLKLRRWGNVADGTTFTSVFHAGQVLFGKRRAYQRKVAVADFDGVCSGDIYVLEPKNEHLLPELLPFICQTDGFFEHAVGTSAGSLSPRTNWDSLASYDFPLPPLEEQRRIVEMLKALEDVINVYFNLTEKLNDLSLIVSSIICEEALVDLKDFAVLVTKGTTPTTMNFSYVSEGVPFLRAEDVVNTRLDFDLCKMFIDRITHNALARSQIKSHDVLLTIAGTIGRVALVGTGEVEANCNQAVAIVRCKTPLQAEFIAAWLQSADAQKQMRGEQVTGTISNLSLGKIKHLKVPLLEESQMQGYCNYIRYINMARTELKQRIDSAQRLKSHALNSFMCCKING